MSVHSGVDAAEDVLTKFIVSHKNKFLRNQPSDFSSRLPLSGRSPEKYKKLGLVKRQCNDWIVDLLRPEMCL